MKRNYPSLDSGRARGPLRLTSPEGPPIGALGQRSWRQKMKNNQRDVFIEEVGIEASIPQKAEVLFGEQCSYKRTGITKQKHLSD
ncbi:unnamed protein product [Menidia menidia]|uniref:(Atlantic silverside) hypothetical protein n=1 Tax=Menidia menidia TaxID=238744 RepID=A0A8S4AVL4_9TELE|nr:unnamed protein product [Menidia menidia]